MSETPDLLLLSLTGDAETAKELRRQAGQNVNMQARHERICADAIEARLKREMQTGKIAGIH